MNERQLQQLENDGLSDVVELINSQKQRIAELTAHVERLRSVLDVNTSAVQEVLNETPAQSLGMIKAQAIEEACNNVSGRWYDNEPRIMKKSLMNYAKQLRGEK